MKYTKACAAHLRPLLVYVTSDRSSSTEEAGPNDGVVDSARGDGMYKIMIFGGVKHVA